MSYLSIHKLGAAIVAVCLGLSAFAGGCVLSGKTLADEGELDLTGSGGGSVSPEDAQSTGGSDESGAGGQGGGAAVEPPVALRPPQVVATVSRWSPGSEGAVAMCDLDDGGACSLLEVDGLPNGALQAHFVSSGDLMVVYSFELVSVDPDEGTINWTVTNLGGDRRAHNVFPLETPGGGVVGVAVGPRSDPDEVSYVMIYDREGDVVGSVAMVADPYSSWTGATQDPHNPDHFFGVGFNLTALTRFNLAGETQEVTPMRSAILSDGYAVAAADGQLRAAWVGNDFVGRVRTHSLINEIVSEEATCALNTSICAPLSVAPDPSTELDTLAVCSDSMMGIRRDKIVRLFPEMKQFDPCETILDIANFDTDAYLTGITIKDGTASIPR
ncbi:MAG: hypothetical protein AAGA56_15945 [Myxococcota bacterium]